MTPAYLPYRRRPSNWISGHGSPSRIWWMTVAAKRRSRQIPTGFLSRHIIILLPWRPRRRVCNITTNYNNNDDDEFLKHVINHPQMHPWQLIQLFTTNTAQGECLPANCSEPLHEVICAKSTMTTSLIANCTGMKYTSGIFSLNEIYIITYAFTVHLFYQKWNYQKYTIHQWKAIYTFTIISFQ